MSERKTFAERVSNAFKALFDDPAGSPWNLGDVYWGPRNTAINFQLEAGAPNANSIVMACLNWIITAYPEAPLQVLRPVQGGVESVADHPLLGLLDQPNAYYSGLDLMAATLDDFNLSGNAYWIVPLKSAGRAAEIWYEPSFSMRPAQDARGYVALSGWQYKRGAAWQDVDERKFAVVHFRRGIDKYHQRLGVSRLTAAYREMYTDEEAAQYTAILLRNRGIPGLIVSPRNDAAPADRSQLEMLKANLMAKTTGDRRGEPIFFNAPTEITKLSFSPGELDMQAIRQIPEERISALMGVPAIVAGLGAGLERSTYSNFDQAREQAWYDNIIPTQRVIAMTIQNALLPIAGGRPGEQVSYNLKQVKALQEDQDRLYVRVNVGVAGGWLMINEARSATGWPLLPAGNVLVDAAPAPAAKALPALPERKSLAGPAARQSIQSSFERDVKAWYDEQVRQAQAEVVTPAPLVAGRNGHREDR
jgi:phage portal protein BeeE